MTSTLKFIVLILFNIQFVSAAQYQKFQCEKGGVEESGDLKPLFPEIETSTPVDRIHQKNQPVCFGCSATEMLQNYYSYYLKKDAELNKAHLQRGRAKFAVPHLILAGIGGRKSISGGNAYGVLQNIKANENFTVLVDQGYDIDEIRTFQEALTNAKKCDDVEGRSIEIDGPLSAEATKSIGTYLKEIVQGSSKDEPKTVTLPPYNVHVFEPTDENLLLLGYINDKNELQSRAPAQIEELKEKMVYQEVVKLLRQPPYQVEISFAMSGFLGSEGHSIIFEDIQEKCCVYKDKPKFCEPVVLLKDWGEEDSKNYGWFRAKPFFEATVKENGQYSYIRRCYHDALGQSSAERKGFEECKDEIQGSFPLHYLARAGDLKTIKKYFDKNYKDLLFTKDSYGDTPFHRAVRGHSLETVQFLFNQGGAQLLEEKSQGETPLLIAINNGTVETVKFLIDKGANIHIKGGLFNREPLLLIALKADEYEKAQALIDAGADVNERGPLGSLLSSLASSGYADLYYLGGIKFLLKAGAKDSNFLFREIATREINNREDERRERGRSNNPPPNSQIETLRALVGAGINREKFNKGDWEKVVQAIQRGSDKDIELVVELARYYESLQDEKRLIKDFAGEYSIGTPWLGESGLVLETHGIKKFWNLKEINSFLELITSGKGPLITRTPYRGDLDVISPEGWQGKAPLHAIEKIIKQSPESTSLKLSVKTTPLLGRSGVYLERAGITYFLNLSQLNALLKSHLKEQAPQIIRTPYQGRLLDMIGSDGKLGKISLEKLDELLN